MRWHSHKLSTFAIVLALSSDAFFAGIATASSIFPDAIEFVFQTKQQRYSGHFWKHHRKLSHWPYIYVLPLVCCFWFWEQTHSLSYLISGAFFLGASLHLFEDFLSVSGIPFGFKLSRRKGLGFYKTGALSEYICVLSFIFAALLSIYFTNASFDSWLQHMSKQTVDTFVTFLM